MRVRPIRLYPAIAALALGACAEVQVADDMPANDVGAYDTIGPVANPVIAAPAPAGAVRARWRREQGTDSSLVLVSASGNEVLSYGRPDEGIDWIFRRLAYCALCRTPRCAPSRIRAGDYIVISVAWLADRMR